MLLASPSSSCHSGTLLLLNYIRSLSRSREIQTRSTLPSVCKGSFESVGTGGNKNIVLPWRWADRAVKSPFEEVGLICHWAMEEAAMQKLPDYKEIISSNPPVVLHHLASILHCLSYLFPRLHLFTRFVLLQLPLKYIYFSSLLNRKGKLPPSFRHPLLCRNPPLSTCCVIPAVLIIKFIHS